MFMNPSSYRRASAQPWQACFLALVGLTGACLQAQLAPAPPIQWDKARDTVTEEKLEKEAAAVRPMNDQLVAMMRPMPEVRPSLESSLYRKSIILFDGEMHTVVPVGSVLHLPPALRNRVVAKPQGDFTIWPNFLKRNAAWLAGKEVPLKMAKGDAKLAAAVLRETAQSPLLLVSVYRQCPISVLEAAPEPESRASR